MFDTRPALTDMAEQIRSCRTTDGLTLQQLATRSGVAASTIHKVESQQMVPTVSVLLKIAKGLGRRPEDLIRDNVRHARSDGPYDDPSDSASDVDPTGAADRPPAGVWKLNLAANETLPPLHLMDLQRAILMVEKGTIELRSGHQRIHLNAGDSVEIEGERSIETVAVRANPTSLTVVACPRGDLPGRLGAPVEFRATLTRPR